MTQTGRKMWENNAFIVLYNTLSNLMVLIAELQYIQCSMALGLTRPLTEMSTRNISWG